MTRPLHWGGAIDVRNTNKVLTSLIAERDDCVCWIRSEGSLAADSPSLVGWGRVMTLTSSGADRTESLRTQWRNVIGRSQWEDTVSRPGTGPLSFGTITFSPNSSEDSILVIPEVIVGCDAMGYWLTVLEILREDSLDIADTSRSCDSNKRDAFSPCRFSDDDAQSAYQRDTTASASDSLAARWACVAHDINSALTSGTFSEITDAMPVNQYSKVSTTSMSSPGITEESGHAINALSIYPGTLSDDEFQIAVAQATERLSAGEAVKVVLARDLQVHCPTAPTMGSLATYLARSFPTTWTFVVDTMVGATPELLMRLSNKHVHSRVLAGTARRGNASAAEVDTMANWLMHSSKNRREHEVASRSAVDALEPLCAWVEASEPFILRLPNVLHVATDVRAEVAGDTGALALVDALHPTAAVCGTPRKDAAHLIDVLEHQDRGRYSGPVGWVDWHGEGEWCIALRCASRVSDTEFNVWGGGGIMPDSQPRDEWEETRAKMRPMLEALAASSAR